MHHSLTPLEKTDLNIGIIPLTDCAPLVVAVERGLFAEHGLNVKLSIEPSWSAIRDKVSCGLLDGAHMLAAMPLASTLGVSGMHQPMIVPCSLGLNGNAITVSESLYQRMCQADPIAMSQRPLTATALRRVIDQQPNHDSRPLTFAMVFPVSSHHYQLRYWLAEAGIDPDRDARLVVVPPPLVVEQLAAGRIDGYCVGEPWNQLAVAERIGRTVVTGYEIWNNSPEKVFGVTQSWAEHHPRTLHTIVRVLIEAGRWLDESNHRMVAAQILADGHYVEAPVDVIASSLLGHYRYEPRQDVCGMPDFNVFFRYAAMFPWRSHAVWFLTQMMRWGQIDRAVNLRSVAEQVYQPAIYRNAASELGIAHPLVDSKIEGQHAGRWVLEQASMPIEMGPDCFLDGRIFDPSAPLQYMRDFEFRTPLVDAGQLARANI